MAEAPAWVPSLQRLLAPRERIGGNAWAERERWIGADEGGPMAGRWRSLPWQREILDALADPGVRWLVVLKATQVGVSELVRNAIGRWAVHDPGDVLWVMTTREAAERSMVKLQQMFQNTPVLRPLLTGRRTDKTLLELVLANGMRIVIGWAGSMQSLSSDPYPRVVMDEVGLYRWAGSPVATAADRVKVFGNRGKVVLLSSPVSDGDQIVTAHRGVADRRVFAVPCGECGKVQPWEWERVRWPGGTVVQPPTDPEARIAEADKVSRDQSAWLQCDKGGCEGRIQPREAMWEDGSGWVQEQPASPSDQRAYHVPEAWHLSTSLSGLVAKFLRRSTPADVERFWTGSLGRVYRTTDASTAMIAPSLFVSRATHAAGVVPSWATVILSTADTQLAGWWLMVRAWGPGGKSRLLDWGWVESEAELVARGLEREFPVEGATSAAKPARLAIDTGGGMRVEAPDGSDADGSRTKQVYALIRRTPRAIALKGEGDKHAHAGDAHRARVVDGLELHLLNRNFYADALAALLRATDPILWEECRGAEESTYTRQMTSEERVLVTSSSGQRWMWRKKSSGTPNHLWDCARYQVWLSEHMRADGRKVPTWTPPPAPRRERRERGDVGGGWKIGR